MTRFDVVDLSDPAIVRKPLALDYVGLLGRYVVITVQNPDFTVRWSATGVVVRVSDVPSGVDVDFEDGTTFVWLVHDVAEGRTLTFDVCHQAPLVCDCPPGLTGGHYLGCPVGDAEQAARRTSAAPAADLGYDSAPGGQP